MRFKIMHGENCVNTILASEDFVQAYCNEHRYTYEPVPEPAPETPVDPVNERLTTLEVENKELRAKLAAAVESGAMLEDCIVEMAGVVYA